MKIFIQSPNINSPHGGIRVINEWANRLTELGHRVILFNQAGPVRCDFMPIKCKIVNTISLMGQCDIAIITSPHGAFLLDKDQPVKKFVFLQMLEHLFNPSNRAFKENCVKLYKTHYPLISISQWNIRQLQTIFKRTAPIHYVGNGVNLDDFPISYADKDGDIILLESPEPTNQAKDVDKIAVKAAIYFKQKGYRIKGFGLKKATDNIYDEYIVRPSLDEMNRLYQEATIMIKATKYDARSTAPLEAMTKGTVTIRGIIEGDDDLNDQNSYKTKYNLDKVIDSANFALNNPVHFADIKNNAYWYVQTYNWDYWMDKINKILCS
jgi:hypothetical protein